MVMRFAIYGFPLIWRSLQPQYAPLAGWGNELQVLEAVSICSRATGDCVYGDIERALGAAGLGRDESRLHADLARLAAAGLILRASKPLRFRYSVTVRGVGLLNELERRLRAFKIRAVKGKKKGGGRSWR